MAVVTHPTWDRNIAWVRNADGNLRATSAENIKLMLALHPVLQEVLQYDEWQDAISVMRAFPGNSIDQYPHQLRDEDEVDFAAFLSTQGLTTSVSLVSACIRSIAMTHQVNPLRDWLLGLEWDGVERVERWLTTYAGARNEHYERTVGRKFLIGAVARVLEPGCKCDTMLVLEGPQGIRKSTLLRELCGADYFTDQVGDITNKDSAQAIQGRWFVEVPEMDKFTRKQANEVKDFLARQEDRYRPPYGRNVVNRPRRCIFVGTINPVEGAGYLKDATGARRFWPVLCSRIDLAAVRRDRDQLWAEAVHMRNMEQTWWIDTDEQDVVEDAQADRREADPWEDRIALFVRDQGLSAFTSAEILREVIGMPLERQDQKHKNRVAGVLHGLGARCYVTRETLPNGRRGKPTRYYTMSPLFEDGLPY